MGTSTAAAFDVAAVRAVVPALHQRVHGKPLVYLDNAATSQKPQAVIDAISSYYAEDNANVHRGVHTLSERATEAFERARESVKRLLGARSTLEIVFTRNATEAINLVARTWADAELHPGDEVIISALEHHSNIVPWQLACARTGATLRVVPIDDAGTLRMDEFRRMLSEKTRLVAVVQISNALGTINPVEEIARLAHAAGAVVLVDGSQAVPHVAVDVNAMGADFYVFTGHKVYGPTGIGALYGREALLERMPPFLGGGDMIRTVTFESSTWNDLPYKFEAGTPNIAGAVGLGAAIAFFESLPLDAVALHETALLEQAASALSAIDGVRLVGTSPHKTAVLSFVMDHVHPHDIGTVLDREGVAIRTGHHCAQPLMDRLGIPATARASFACYNTADDVSALAEAVARAHALLA